MTKSIGSSNQTAAAASHNEPIVLVHIACDDPVYAHSGVGVITYGSTDYLGVGHLGSISAPKESNVVGPGSVTLELSGLSPNNIGTAMSSASYGDAVTIYQGYRQDDGTLVDTPWIVWSGSIDRIGGLVGPECTVSVELQHDIAALGEISGRRCTDEDQQNAYLGDTFFSHIADVPNLKLVWGGGTDRTGTHGGSGERDGYRRR